MENNVLHQRDGSVRPNFGEEDGGSFVGVLMGVVVEREVVVGTILGTDSGKNVDEGRFAVVVNLMSTAPAGTDYGIIQSLYNISRA